MRAAESARLADANRARMHERRAAARADAADKLIDDMLSHSLQTGQRPRESITFREILDTASNELDTGQRAYEPEVAAYVRMKVGNLYTQLGLLMLAEPHFRKALELRREALGEQHMDTVETMEKLGRCYRDLGMLDQAADLMERALRTRIEMAGSKYDGFIAVGLNSLAMLKRRQIKFDEAAELYVEALDVYRTLFGPDDRNLPVVLGNLGVVYLSSGNRSEAARVLREALDLIMSAQGEFAEQNPSMLTNLAHAVDDPAEAELLTRHAIAIIEHNLGSEHPALAIPCQRLAGLIGGTEGDQLYRRAIELLRRSGKAADVSTVMGNYAGLLERAGRTDEAEAAMREALQIAEQRLAPNAEATLNWRTRLGRMLVGADCLDEAEKLLLAAESALASTRRPGDEFLSAARKALVQLYDRRNALHPSAASAAAADYWRSRLTATTQPSLPSSTN
ncbi:MAG: hypothetical protein CHACPFDD_03879 [Phycisphaerae bacterium]|nr:hypothetical protein [Phycisphaerae bacterium]